MKKNSPSFLLILLFVFATCAFTKIIFFTAHAAKKSLSEQVKIRRDTFGIPHILGETEEAAAFGFGYAQAEDHCVNIASALVSARGENAKYFGDGVEGDFRLKQFDNYGECQKNFSQLDPTLQLIFKAYAAGVNHYIAQHRNELPKWIPVFNEIDVLANIHEGSINAVGGVVRRLQEKYNNKKIAAVEVETFSNETEEAGSNAFAIAPSRSTSGKAMLLGNPHLNWSSLYWEAHVTVPGKINFFGSTLPGLPVLRAGFNENLGFVQTNNAPDMADVYALKLDPQNSSNYIFDGKAMPIIKHEASVEIKNSDGSLRTEKKIFERSHLGEIIFRTSTHAFAYRSTQLESYRHFEGFYRLSKAKNLREWMDVMKLNLLNYSNFTYADAAGNILYFWNARLPKRIDDGTNYELDVPAETSKYVWQSLHPITDFPQLLNPRGGYTQNCNNAPWYASLRDPIDPAKFPSYFEKSELALRPQLALEMLESQAKFSINDVIRLKFNTKILMADRLKPDLLQAIKALQNPSQDLQNGLRILEAWDNTTSAESRGSIIFQRFVTTYFEAVKKPYATPWDAKNPAHTPTGISDANAALKHFEEAVKWTRETFGREDIAWGEVHRYRFKDLDFAGDGAPGALGAFRVMTYKQMPDNKRVAGWIGEDKPFAGFGDAWSIAVEFSKPVKAFSVLAYGQTTNQNSKHSRDQIELFARHQFKKIWFTEKEIKTNLEREYKPGE